MWACARGRHFIDLRSCHRPIFFEVCRVDFPEFPQCRHGETSLSLAQRQCRSPKLAGLKWVTPAQCERCYCRDHEIDAADEEPAQRAGRLACACLGDRLDSTESITASHEAPRLHLCHDPRHGITDSDRCRNCPDYVFPLITPRTPIDQVRRIFELPPIRQMDGWWNWENVQTAHRDAMTDAAVQEFRQRSRRQGRGIVVVGGGKYFVSTYVTIRVLRQLGCLLPIEVWHLSGEITDSMLSLLEPLGVICRDADALRKTHSFRFLDGHWWRGWQLKSYALLHCSFDEVLLLDSDSYPVRNPEFLFECSEYRQHGAIFWPDLEANSNLIPAIAWDALGVSRWAELPTESGQLVVNTLACQREVNLAARYNEHADFVYRILYGDKDTFPMAWHRLGRPYGRLWPHATFDRVAIRQFDDAGQTLFLHRVHDKFRLSSARFDGTPQLHVENVYHADFPLEDFCFEVVRELARHSMFCQETVR